MKDEETGAGDSVVAAGNRKIEKESPKAICVNSHTVQVPTSSATMLAEGVRENPFHKLNKLDISEVDVAAITLTDDNDDAFLPNNFPERGLEIVAGDDNDDAEEVSQSWTMKNNRKTNQLTLDYKNIRKSRKRKGKNVECDIDTICKGDFAEQNILLSSDGDIPCDNRQKIIIGDALLSQEKDFSNDDGRISFYSIFTSKSRFSLLDVQEVELDDETLKSISESCPSVEDESFVLDPSEEDKEMSSKKDTNVCGTKNTSKGEKKSKKKERKKTQVDEDVAKILEQLTLKVDVKRPGPKSKKFVGGTSTNEGSAIMSSVARKQLKKKRKKIDSESSVEHAEKDPGAELLLEDRAVKTAVRKKKNKKRARQNSIRISSEEVSDFKVNETQLEKSVEQDVETSALCSVLSNVSDPPAIDEKKNTLGKVCLEEKKDKKGPGKKQIAAMVEAIKKFEVEEKRVKLEEEAKLRKDEEEERLRNEKFILEQEKRDKKKQKEKEKRERLKAEGKLLSKSQKQSRARMEASLAALRQQGIDVPQIGEKRVCTTRQADFKKTSKKNSWPKSNSNINSAEIKLMTVDSIGNDASPIVDVPISETCDIKKKSEISLDGQTLESQGRHFLTSVINCNGETNINKNIGEISSRHVSYEEGSPSEMLRQSSSESESGDKKNITKRKVTAVERIKKLSEESEKNRSTSKLRSPVVCVLGHVDTGKTKLLDKIRKSHVQDGEAGGITQQIGATMIPQEALQEKCKMAKSILEIVIKIPGLLIIDTPGHESFSNLRSRGSSLCDIAILVVDIMHGLEPQTVESINLLKQKKTPFIVALNKIDRLYGWKPGNEDVENIIKSQGTNTKLEFDDRCKEVILQFAHQGLNATLFYENSDPRSYISIVPTSALTGEGMGNLLALVIQLTQSMMAKRLAYSEELLATVLEVKAISGLGTTIDVILVNGRLREADTIILAGQDGPVVTQIRSLLMPQPLKELRVKNPYQEHREVVGAQGVKICGKDLEKAIAGLPLFVAHHKDEVKILREKIISSFQNVMNSIRLAERGVYVQSSTLGSLEVLLKLLKASNIPYAGIKIGPVVKKDVMKASVMLEHEILYAVILAFDVKIERDAQELADNLGVIIFHADIIYHLLDTFTAFKESKEKEKEEIKKLAVFPCKLRIVSENVMNTRKHIRIYVIVEAGVLKIGTPLCVPSKHLDIGTVTSIEINKKHLESAKKGDEVLVKIKNYVEDAPKIYGEHFNQDDPLISKITRQTIDICKEYYRDDLSRSDWQLMGELKKVFLIT